MFCKNCGEPIKKYNKFCNTRCSAIYNNKIRKLSNYSVKNINKMIYCSGCGSDMVVPIKTNESIFEGWDADVIIEDLKIAILWNGKWHYEKITKKHSVEQVQIRDRIKIDEILKSGFKPYIIKDMGKYDVNFVEKEFKKFLKKFKIIC